MSTRVWAAVKQMSRVRSRELKICTKTPLLLSPSASFLVLALMCVLAAYHTIRLQVANVNVTTLRRVTTARAAAGKIDDVTHIKSGQYYLYRGVRSNV